MALREKPLAIITAGAGCGRVAQLCTERKRKPALRPIRVFVLTEQK